jgi:hypothetical protein
MRCYCTLLASRPWPLVEVPFMIAVLELSYEKCSLGLATEKKRCMNWREGGAGSSFELGRIEGLLQLPSEGRKKTLKDG